MITNCIGAHDRELSSRFTGVTLALIEILGHRLDKDAEAIVPRWSHNPGELLVDRAEYELAQVPLTNISFVTGRTIKVIRRPVLNNNHGKAERILTRVRVNLMACVCPFRWSRIRSWNAI